MTNELTRTGYWSIATQKHLKSYSTDSPNLDEFDSLNISGKGGRLLGIIRNNTRIENMKKLEKMAQSVGIQKQELHKIILPELEKASDGMVELHKDSLDNIIGVDEYIFEQRKIYEISGQVFENINPNEIERITIDTMDETKKTPLLESELYGLLTNKGFKEEDITLSTNLQSSFSLIQRLSKFHKEAIYSNEYVWGANHEKIAHAFINLDLGDKQSLKTVIEAVQNKQGLPLEYLPKINKEILNLGKKVGMINPTIITSNRNIEKEFNFSPNFLESSPYLDDIMDDVKILIASIRFGEHYTPHSTIKNPAKFLSYLIRNKRIGPHSANGTDYTLLERRGIVRVTRDMFYEDRYYLELLRFDVAQEALKVLENEGFGINFDEINPSATAFLSTSNFKSPEEIRVELGKSPEYIEEAMDYISRVLRDETL